VSREGVELGSQAGHPFSHAYALLWSSVLGVMRREREQARKLAEEAIAISAEQGFAFVLAGARLIRGWTLIDPREEDEQQARAIDGFRKEMANLAAGGTQICAPMIFGYLADAYCDRGRISEGLTAVDDALELSHSTQQRFWDAELHRIKGKLMLQESGEAEGQAERLFQQALGVACAQQARSLELRAAMSLCRLWQRRGAVDQARGLLAPVYARFTEGFETADLREAKEQLDELS
jgi:predicted ATPase